ncbi:17032_t:CDS:2, partial [Gigaspora rosea]
NLSEWYKIVCHSRFVRDKNKLTILNEFKTSDEIIPALSTELPNFSKDRLTSKLLNFKNLNSCDSGINDLSIDNYIN